MAWWVIRCTGGREGAAQARLDRIGYPGAWWPTKEVSALSGAKKRGLRSVKDKGDSKAHKKKRVPFISGYVFIEAEGIDVQRIRSHPESKLFMAPLIVNGRAVQISDKDMANMHDMPDRLKERIDSLEAQARADREAKKPIPGAEAVVISGAWSGSKGLVQEVNGNVAVLDIGGLLHNVRVPVDALERTA